MVQLPYIKSPQEAIFRDRLETKAADWIQPWDGVEALLAALIGIPLSKTSISHSGASFTPAAIRTALRSFTTFSMEYQVDLQHLPVRDLGDIQMHVTDLAECRRRIYEALLSVFTAMPQTVPLIVGGDHSVSFPSVQAFAEAHPGTTIGVIHFDAHHDVRHPQDGGLTNGTPFRSIVESGAVEGRNIAQIGIRGFMNSEAYYNYAVGSGMHVFTSREVRRQGIDSILRQALAAVTQRAELLYVSFDMDVLDQSFAPGCPAIGTGGLDAWDALDALHHLGTLPQVRAIDFVCIDPNVDVRNVTSRLAVQLMLTFLAGVAKRK
ncbi:formimidoylglutamase [Paenibacillus cremeus]|uniref:Formimidoylglutamase n=1 Tax=Paenibacillus cremeus TaxID=2163881 RepID=A0A559JMC4_9BACL|nr:formimidoylglutamase [Paenibacillus cremeus]TVY01020.1 formimidoylglutamase [Paenibacillus cremeus]